MKFKKLYLQFQLFFSKFTLTNEKLVVYLRSDFHFLQGLLRIHVSKLILSTVFLMFLGPLFLGIVSSYHDHSPIQRDLSIHLVSIFENSRQCLTNTCCQIFTLHNRPALHSCVAKSCALARVNPLLF